jgi:hypothetical protein
MVYNLEGTIKEIGEIVTFESGFKKREVVITTADEKYPQDIKLDFLKDGVEKLDAYKIGDTATVAFSIRGNEYNGKYYVNLNAISIGVIGAGGKVESKTVKTKPVVADKSGPSDDDGDDLPF